MKWELSNLYMRLEKYYKVGIVVIGGRKMEMPVCCGNEMNAVMELGRFIEVQCNRCKDVVYVKMFSKSMPVMIDD